MAKTQLLSHRKFKRLRRLLDVPASHALGYLEMLWHSCYASGDAFVGDADDVEDAADFPGPRGKFTTIAHECGFLDKDENGNYSVHDLLDHAPRYVQLRAKRNLTKHPPQNAHSMCAQNGDLSAHCAPKRGTPNPTQPNPTQPPPNPPPQTAGLGGEEGARAEEEKTAGEEKKTRTGGVIDLPPLEDLLYAWTQFGCAGHAQVRVSPSRSGWWQMRLADDWWRANWRAAVERLGRSDHASGRGNWQGIFIDTFLKDPDCARRALEGQFDDKTKPRAETLRDTIDRIRRDKEAREAKNLNGACHA